MITSLAMNIEGWNVVDEASGVLWREYPFTKGAYATTMVFRGADGLVVVSPGTGLGVREYDALKELGEVRALVANNTLHTMGQPGWRARFPDAVSYCPPGAVGAMNKKAPAIGFRSLEALALPEHASWDDPPGYKTGEAIFRVTTGKGSVWYTGDLLTNIQRTSGPPLSWILSWADSAPGFRLFKPAVWFAIQDRKALRAWALGRIAEDPPAVIVPAHGPPIDGAGLAALAKTQIERL